MSVSVYIKVQQDLGIQWRKGSHIRALACSAGQDVDALTHTNTDTHTLYCPVVCPGGNWEFLLLPMSQDPVLLLIQTYSIFISIIIEVVERYFGTNIVIMSYTVCILLGLMIIFS